MKIDGGCHCGFVSYKAEIDPESVTICHCTDCQTLSGSAFRTLGFTREGTFKLLSGIPKIYVRTSQSGKKRQLGFCPECGTPLYSRGMSDDTETYAIRIGTVRQRDNLAPRTQIWWRSSQRWIADLGSISRFETQPDFNPEDGVG